jgi:predicted nucleotidyltransferase
MHQVILQGLDSSSQICRRHGVRRLGIFGSAARASDFDPGSSDADCSVELAGGSGSGPLDDDLGLRVDLSRLFGRPVDLVEYSAIRNPYLRADIDRSREPVDAA